MRKKFFIIVFVIFAAVFAILYLFQKPVGLALFERAVDHQVGIDNSASLGDGLHVGLCGTGSPLPNPDRAGACNVVIAGDQIYVVDSGEGSARNLNLMGISAAKVDGVFFTHFHSDHIDGLGPLMLFHWTQGAATTPLPVYGPTGVAAIVEGFNAAYKTDNGYRTAHHGEAVAPPQGGGGEARSFTMTGEQMVVLEKDGLKVTAFTVDHGPVKPAVGYRFDYKGRSVVISGDLAKSPSLERAAKGADILFHEALQPVMVKQMTAATEKHGQKGVAKITRDILDYHASPEDAADSAKIAGVRQLVLSHLIPPIPNRYFYPAFLGDAPNRFEGPIVVGEDGMLFSLPANSNAIEQRNLL